MIGTTRSPVNVFMKKLRKLGFIKYNGSIEIHSSLLNVVLHDQSQNKKPDDNFGGSRIGRRHPYGTVSGPVPSQYGLAQKDKNGTANF
jgi:hypothetical protein